MMAFSQAPWTVDLAHNVSLAFPRAHKQLSLIGSWLDLHCLSRRSCWQLPRS